MTIEHSASAPRTGSAAALPAADPRQGPQTSGYFSRACAVARAGAADLQRRIAGWPGAAVRAAAREREARRAAARLRCLDDHLLRDIGLERHQIGNAYRGGLERCRV